MNVQIIKKSIFIPNKKSIFKGCILTFVIAITAIYYMNHVYSSKIMQKRDNKNVIYNRKPKNIIMMISDGLGPASVSFAREYYQYIHKKPFDFQLPLDRILVGQSRTKSSSNLITDSAAGATAFSCRLKTYNGAIGMDSNKVPCGTVLESAKHHKNMLTGIVVTSTITHATPGSFSAHVLDREQESDIALQQIGDNPLGRSVDLMFGGGYCFFLPNSTAESCRLDNKDLFNEAKTKHGFKTVLYNDREKFDELSASENVLPIISLFTPSHMSFEIDRDENKEPSLTEMTRKALDILYKSTKDKDNGFFLLVEGSRIDMAAHSNDAPTHVHEILEYQNVIKLVTDFIDQHPDTMMISTSDHETGGLSLAKEIVEGNPEYMWYPEVIKRVKISTIKLAEMIKIRNDEEYVLDLLKEQLGITDTTSDELCQLLNPTSEVSDLDHYLANMISTRARLGWSTHGHSGVDVNLYAYGTGSNQLIGNHENIEIGKFIINALDLNLTDITIKLNN